VAGAISGCETCRIDQLVVLDLLSLVYWWPSSVLSLASLVSAFSTAGRTGLHIVSEAFYLFEKFELLLESLLEVVQLQVRPGVLLEVLLELLVEMLVEVLVGILLKVLLEVVLEVLVQVLLDVLRMLRLLHCAHQKFYLGALQWCRL
jgi:hypothetical protein